MQTCSTSLQGLGAGPYRKAEVPPPTIGFLGETSATAARARHVVGTGAAVASTPTETLIVVGTPNLSSQGAGFTNSWGSSLKLMRSFGFGSQKAFYFYSAKGARSAALGATPAGGVCVCVDDLINHLQPPHIRAVGAAGFSPLAARNAFPADEGTHARAPCPERGRITRRLPAAKAPPTWRARLASPRRTSTPP